MTNHYYSKNPGTESNPMHWEFNLRNRTFRFKTDNGVFSKKEVDFGSRLLIEAFHLPDEPKGDILDLGCGYGPIGLSVAFAYPERKVDMADVNSRAIQLAKENAALNQIGNVHVFESDVYAGVTKKDYAAVLTNPPIRAGKQVVHEILSGSYERLAPGGELWVVIQKKQGAASAAAKMEEVFGNVETAAKKKGYLILVSKKN